MKAYQQVITELLPEPYASLAIERCDYPDREYQHEIKSVLSFAFVWFNTPEGLDFWSKVDEHLRTGTPLPPAPFESRILTLESRIAFLESLTPPAAPVVDEVAAPVDDEVAAPDAGEGYRLLEPGEVIEAGDQVWLPYSGKWGDFHQSAIGSPLLPGCSAARRPIPTPVYPTTPLPEGCARWVYRGNAWVSPGRVHWTARNFHYGDPCGCASFGQTNGLGILEYWEAVRKHPRYRLLVSGEVIRDGDEALDTHAVGVGALDVWVPSTSVGREYIPTIHTVIRRPITKYTDA